MNDIDIRRILPSDGAVLGAVRLRALHSDPRSFGSTHKQEAAFADEVWDGRAAAGADGEDAATFIAIRDKEPLGLITGIRDGAITDVFNVYSMWVAPEARGKGIGRMLLQKVEGWVSLSGGTQVKLSVMNEASAAVRLYKSAGYVPDGSREQVAHMPRLEELDLTKQIDQTGSHIHG